MSKYIDAEKLLEKEKALLKRLMAFRNALAGEEAKCADARIKLLEKVIDDIANAPAVSVLEDDDNSFLENSTFAKILEPYEDKTIRYIDVDKLKAVIRKFYPNDLEILEQIDNAAVEDIQPVIHAKWERRETLMGSFLVCGNCGSFFFATLETAYCPYCGAKMNIRGAQCEL